MRTLCFFLTSFLCYLSALFSSPYQYEIAACLIFQNEAFYLKEWIEYHRLIGVEHFYLFDNGSTDDYMPYIAPYIHSGLVELYSYPYLGSNQAEYNEIQCSVYNYALQLACGKVKWLAIIDADEFIFPVQSTPLISILNDYEDYGGVYLNYLMFGTAHIEKMPKKQLITETLTYSASKPTAFGKSIVRPERVSLCTDPHRMWYHFPFMHVDTRYRTFDWTPYETDMADDRLLLCHYYLGDMHHAKTIKYPRRRKWSNINLDTYLQEYEWMNATKNTCMKKFAAKLKKRMSYPYRPKR